MPQTLNDPVLNAFVTGTMLLSVTACMNLIFMRRKSPLLSYEPRRPVPWGAVGSVLAVTLLVSVAGAALNGKGGDGGLHPKPASPSGLVVGLLLQCLIVGAVLFVISVFTNATSGDLGLPASGRQCIRDLFIGAVACLAALAPVHLVQVTMMYLFFPKEMESGHPIIKMVMAAPDLLMLLLTGITTVVVAPICEEIAFRLLLQGWLERWEDRKLGWRRQAIESPPPIDESQLTDDDGLQSEAVLSDAVHSLPEVEPPRRGVAGLSYGWFPILVSSAMFGLAHYGYGPEPVPIFLLGLALGYVYQRTHRIIPGIVAHALFNLFTMVVLWRMVYHHG